MNHFLKSSFIIPNNDIKIITIAIKHRPTPKIINIFPSNGFGAFIKSVLEILDYPIYIAPIII